MIDEKIDDQLENKNVVIFAEGTELTVDVPSEQTVLNYHFESALDWEVKTDAEWLEIDPMSGKAGKDIKIQIKVAKNKDKEARTGYADLTLSNDESYRITINQAGEGDENDENEDIVVEIPNNQIWYTSVNGKIVEPYSGEKNNYADALTTFGVNIVSNTYVDGKGVIEFDGEVTEVGELAFYGCNDCTTNCYNLTSFILPQSVTSIGNHAFDGCRNLQSVTISDNVTHIGEAAFICCAGLKEFNSKYASEDGRCLIIDGTLNSFAPAGLTEYTIPNSVTTIGRQAFYNCSSLESVTIGEGVETVGGYAFFNCPNLNAVHITDLAVWCNIDFINPLTDGNVNFAANPLCYAGSLYLNGELVTDLVIPDGVTEVRIISFVNCSSLTSVTIPDSVTTIGEGAFYYCSSLTSVTIGDSVTTIGDGAFQNCSSLTSVTIGDSVTTIGHAAFGGCSLTSATIPDSVTTIGNYAFYECSSLTSVTIPDSVTTIGEMAFYNCSSLDAVHITDLSAWCRIDFTNKESNPLTFAQNLYLNSELITDLTIPSDITVIKDYAFFSGNSIHNINLHNGITSVGLGAFVGCHFQSVTIPDSVVEIKDSAFTQCSYLTAFKGKFATEDGLALIIDGTFHAFANGSGITEYTIPEGVTTIGVCAFNKSYSLESITIPASVTTIGSNAFWYCISLTSLYCKPTTPPAGGLNMFYGNASVRKIYVPAESYQDYISADGWRDYAAKIIPYDYENNCVIETNASEETKRWLGKWSSTVSRTYCPETGFNEEAVTFEVNIEHNAVSPHSVKVYGLSVIDPTIAVDGIVSANGDLEILNYCYVGNSEGWDLYMWALSEAVYLTSDRHPVYTMSMDEGGNVSCEVGSYNSSPYIVFDIIARNGSNGNISWYDSSLSYYSGPMSWVKVADSGATPSRYSQKVPNRANFQPQADTRLKVVE